MSEGPSFGRKLAGSWQRFWFEDRSSEGLCLVRIFFGLALFLNLTGLWGLFRISQLNPRFPRHEFAAEYSYYLDAFRFPVAGFSWLPAPSFGQFQVLETVQLLLCVALVVGFATRLVTPLLTLALLYPFLTSQFLFHHHAMLLILVLAVLSFSPCNDHFSLDAVIKRDRGSRPLRPIYPIRMLQVLVTLVYLFSAIAKTSSGWMSGGVLESIYLTGRITGPFSEIILSVASLQTLALGTTIIEWTLVFGLWVPQARKLVIAAGVVLHISIDAMMDVRTFGYQMIALYIAFLDPETGTTVGWYDGSSARCRRWQRAVNLLDWLRRINWIDMRELSVAERDANFVVSSSDGRVYRGFEAWRQIFSVLPATFMASFALYLAPITWVGESLYRRMAGPEKSAVGSSRHLSE